MGNFQHLSLNNKIVFYHVTEAPLQARAVYPPPPLPGLARIHALLLYYIDLARAKSEGPSNKFIIQIKQ